MASISQTQRQLGVEELYIVKGKAPYAPTESYWHGKLTTNRASYVRVLGNIHGFSGSKLEMGTNIGNLVVLDQV